MQYLLMIHGDEKAYADMSEEAIGEVMAQHGAFSDALREAGVAVTWAAEMDPPSAATVIRQDGAGGLLVSDGPFSEAREQVGGIYVIDVATREEAVAWAKRMPLTPGVDSVEVRAAL